MPRSRGPVGPVTRSATVSGSRVAKNASWARRSAPRSPQPELSGQGADGGRAAPFGDGQAAAPAAAGGEQANVLEFGDDIRRVGVGQVHGRRVLARRGGVG